MAHEQATAPDDSDVPGLAGERTDMAWSRSALAALVAGGVIVRRVWEHVDTNSARIVVFTLLGTGALVWLTAIAWARAAARTTLEGRRIASPQVLRRVTVATSLYCLAALVLAVIPTDD